MAQSKAQRNTKIRVKRFQATYGSKIKLLRSKTKERELIKLVEENKGKEARALLGRYDEERKAKRRLADRVRRYAKKDVRQRVGSNRPDDEQAAFWRMYDGLVDAGEVAY